MPLASELSASRPLICSYAQQQTPACGDGPGSAGEDPTVWGRTGRFAPFAHLDPKPDPSFLVMLTGPARPRNPSALQPALETNMATQLHGPQASVRRVHSADPRELEPSNRCSGLESSVAPTSNDRLCPLRIGRSKVGLEKKASRIRCIQSFPAVESPRGSMQRTSDEEHQACRALLMMGGSEEQEQPQTIQEEQQPEPQQPHFLCEDQKDSSDHKSASGDSSDDDDDVHDNKEGEASQRGGKRKRVSSEDIRQCFNMPLARAADELGIGTTTLKRICREYGITRWPYRELKSISGSMRHLEQALLLTAQNPQDELRTQLEGRWLMLRQHKFRLLESAPSDAPPHRSPDQRPRSPSWPPAKRTADIRSTTVSSDDEASSREAFAAAQNELLAKAHCTPSAQGHPMAPRMDPRMNEQYAQYLAAAASARSAAAVAAAMPQTHPPMPPGYGYPYPPMMGMQGRAISAPTTSIPSFGFDMAQWTDHHLGYSMHRWSSSPTAVWAPEERLTMYSNYPPPPTLGKVSRVKSDPSTVLQRPFIPATRQAQI